MKHIFWIFVALYASVMMVACNKNNGGGDPIPVVGVGAYGCYSVNTTGQCLDAYGNVISTGSNILQYFSDTWSPQRSIRITRSDVYQEFLRTAMGVCGTGANNYGVADCASWANGGLDIVMTPTSPTTMSVTFRTWPQYQYYANYYAQLPSWQDFAMGFFGVPYQTFSGPYLNPMVIDTQTYLPNNGLSQPGVYQINTNAGFEARFYGPAMSFANRSLIQIRVEAGHIGDNTFTFKLGFPNCISTGGAASQCSGGQGTWFAEGTFARCVTPNCSGGLF